MKEYSKEINLAKPRTNLCVGMVLPRFGSETNIHATMVAEMELKAYHQALTVPHLEYDVPVTSQD